MKKFFFSLQTVLDVRELKKENKVNELAKLKKYILSLQEKKYILIKSIELEKQNFLILSKKYSIDDLIMNKGYIESLYEKMKIIDNEIAKMSFEENKIKDEIIKSTKEINVLNKIKESKKSEYKSKCQIEEDKILQEMIQIKHINNR